MFDYKEKELLDVVNDNDEVIDAIHRADMMSLRDTPGHYLRVIEVFCSDQTPQLSPEHTEAIWLPLHELQAFVMQDVPAKHTLYEDIAELTAFLAHETPPQSPES